MAAVLDFVLHLAEVIRLDSYETGAMLLSSRESTPGSEF